MRASLSKYVLVFVCESDAGIHPTYLDLNVNVCVPMNIFSSLYEKGAVSEIQFSRTVACLMIFGIFYHYHSDGLYIFLFFFISLKMFNHATLFLFFVICSYSQYSDTHSERE